MYNKIFWLPSPIDSTIYKNQNDFIQALYNIFEKDFKDLNNFIYFDNKLVSYAPLSLYIRCEKFLKAFNNCNNTYTCNNCPYINLSAEDIFNHITCREFNKKLKIRTPGIFELQRAIRMNWIRPIIENYTKPEIFYYETEVFGVIKKCFWLKQEKYIVILNEDAKGRLYLNTGYFLYDRKGSARIRKDYNEYIINAKKTPTAS